MTPSPLLEVRALSFSYGEQQAVRSVSFSCLTGEILGILGPNGAGKTTILSCVSGLLTGWGGELSYAGERFDPARSGDRARLGVVPQELALYGDLSGRENLRFFGRMNGLTGADLDAAVAAGLGLASLEDRADDRVDRYSGGMKRRLNIAAGDLHHPPLLLLDEPTVGVDPQSRNHIFETLERLKEGGRTLIYTTHYMEEAQRLCDRVAIINDGEVVGLGTTAELGEVAGTPDADLESIFLTMTGRNLRDE